jgi:hypothetical protein
MWNFKNSLLFQSLKIFECLRRDVEGMADLITSNWQDLISCSDGYELIWCVDVIIMQPNWTQESDSTCRTDDHVQLLFMCVKKCEQCVKLCVDMSSSEHFWIALTQPTWCIGDVQSNRKWMLWRSPSDLPQVRSDNASGFITRLP